VPTLEALAAVSLLRARIPDLRIRVVNVVDLMALQPQSEHPHGLPDEEFDLLFPVGVPVVFVFHGYPAVIHRLTYRRHNHDNIHVRGYKEEGATTPFDIACSTTSTSTSWRSTTSGGCRAWRQRSTRPNNGTPRLSSATVFM
jgi:phosphoketolase